MIRRLAAMSPSDRAYPTCPICDAEARFWLEASDYYYGNPGAWRAYRCEGCGHVFRFPVPSEEELGSAYPEDYYAHSRPVTDLTPRGLRRRGIWATMHYLKRYRGYRHLQVSGSLLPAALARLLLRPLDCCTPEFKPHGRLLDYGCGSGTTVAAMRYYGWDAEGIDFDPRAAAAALEAGVPVRHGSVETLERLPGAYDWIMSSHCVEHVPDPRRLVRAFFAALKPGGTLAVETPNAASLAFQTYREQSYYLTMPVHVHLFSPRSLTRLAGECGFEAIGVAAYSTLFSHRESLLARRAVRRNREAHPRFYRHGRWTGVLGSLLALPVYLRSRAGLCGDCLVMTARKPLAVTEADRPTESVVAPAVGTACAL